MPAVVLLPSPVVVCLVCLHVAQKRKSFSLCRWLFPLPTQKWSVKRQKLLTYVVGKQTKKMFSFADETSIRGKVFCENPSDTIHSLNLHQHVCYRLKSSEKNILTSIIFKIFFLFFQIRTWDVCSQALQASLPGLELICKTESAKVSVSRCAELTDLFQKYGKVWVCRFWRPYMELRLQSPIGLISALCLCALTKTRSAFKIHLKQQPPVSILRAKRVLIHFWSETAKRITAHLKTSCPLWLLTGA